MTDPTPEPTNPTPAPRPLSGLPRPVTDPSVAALAPVAGRAPVFSTPAFDVAKVVEEVAAPPVETGSGHVAGEIREPAEPAEPFAPLDGVEVPADLAAALATYHERWAEWTAAVDAVEAYRDDAQASRAHRRTAISEARRAAARGTKRPAIPAEISEADEAVEVEILSGVVDDRRRRANAAAAQADKLTAKYAGTWGADVVNRFGPALDAATAAAQAAYEAAQRAESVLGQAAHWRSLAIAAELEGKGVRVNEHARTRIMSDLYDYSRSHQYAAMDSRHASPTARVNQLHEAIGALRQSDPAAVPAPDMLSLPGGFVEARDVWRRLYDEASPATKKRFRDRHTGGRPLRHELEG
ncbi:hypothetical protein ACQPYA_01025 [Micromonospora sp. CA-263727]|uniref:hypothetical protein n=1 Tax=Micromonospora sp. CA-263727 TaxID=3239967 RepID=UPI003D8CB1D3